MYGSFLFAMSTHWQHNVISIVSFASHDVRKYGQAIFIVEELLQCCVIVYKIIFFGQVGDNFYIYLEYVSGGSIHTILQEYGKLGESAIRNYTQQILAGLAYLHSKNIVHG